MAQYSSWWLLDDGSRVVIMLWTWILVTIFGESNSSRQELKQIITTSSPEKLTSANPEKKVVDQINLDSVITPVYKGKMYNYIPYPLQFHYHNKKKLVLDLDETLISSSQKHASKHDMAVEIFLNGEPATFYIRKRPHVDHFLETASQWYELVIFTASLSSYANAVIDELDPHRRINRRYYRQSCNNRIGTGYVKDLSIVCKDMSMVAIIDNSPVAYSINRENAIPIEDYIGHNHTDQALLNLLPLLAQMRDAPDVRHVLKGIPRGIGSARPMEYLSKRSNEISVA